MKRHKSAMFGTRMRRCRSVPTSGSPMNQLRLRRVGLPRGGPILKSYLLETNTFPNTLGLPAQIITKSKTRAALFTLWLADRVSLLIHEALGAHDLECVVERVELGLWRAVGAEVGVGPGEVLAVVDGEVHVMQSVVGGAVEELFRPVTRDHVAVVDQDGPDLDSDEEDHVQVALHWADEDEEAVRMLAMGRVAGDESRGKARDSLVWQ